MWVLQHRQKHGRILVWRLQSLFEWSSIHFIRIQADDSHLLEQKSCDDRTEWELAFALAAHSHAVIQRIRVNWKECWYLYNPFVYSDWGLPGLCLSKEECSNGGFRTMPTISMSVACAWPKADKKYFHPDNGHSKAHTSMSRSIVQSCDA